MGKCMKFFSQRQVEPAWGPEAGPGSRPGLEKYVRQVSFFLNSVKQGRGFAVKTRCSR